MQGLLLKPLFCKRGSGSSGVGEPTVERTDPEWRIRLWGYGPDGGSV